ncbi:hypothetical protein B0T16DRAFT_448574 [Cercophora newfieldiana]|uniref:Uncharacterized protein n=1 Tax=Cercophora newfieldiana TaxID=92897 RepID=A0AA40CJT0_9PEZI|nr:hypothetical protein B0T16DRAFT_448574 [Cercophora newfieldiana]
MSRPCWHRDSQRPIAAEGYSYKAVNNVKAGEANGRRGLVEKSLWAKICQTWALEVAAFVAGLGSLVAMVALLRVYDGQRAADWLVTLNFASSLLGNVGFHTADGSVHHRPPWGPEKGVHTPTNLSPPNEIPISWQAWAAALGLVSPQTDMTSVIFDAESSPKECKCVNDDVFSCVLEGFARTLTKTIREWGVLKKGINSSCTYLSQGEARVPAAFVRIQWEWIILPVLVWVFGIITWAVIAFQTWCLRLPTWRDDLLPLVFLYRGANRKQGSVGEVGPLRTAAASGGEPDEVLKADGYSSWAYGTVAEKISVQLQKPSALLESVGEPGVMRLA